MRVLLAWALQGALASLACGQPPPAASPAEPWVRVCLAEAVEHLEIQCLSPRRLRADQVFHQLPGETALLTAQVAGGALQLSWKGQVLARSRFRITLEGDAASRVRLGGHEFSGSFFLLRLGERLTLVNELPLEEYLRGVVPWEIGRHDASVQAAVEAQAIAARTYAYLRLGRYPEAGFDVYADVADQVFRGCSGTDSLTDAAVRATRGVIVWSQGEPLEAYYSSTCGGHTSRIEAVWDKPAAAALRGRRDAPPGGSSYCITSPHFRWSEAWSGADLERTLQETLPHQLRWPPGTPVGALVDLRIRRRDETGRVGELQISTTRGDFVARGDRIRWVLRPQQRPILRSTLFDLQLERAAGAIVRVTLRGGGNGHGVGMCQMGALEMARRGMSAAQILGHYYVDAELLRLY